jgi:general stress protein YciG
MAKKKSNISEELRNYLSELGRKGGKKSAKSRMEKLTPEQRREIARKAAKARWDKKTKT